MIILKDDNTKNRVDILGMTMDDLRLLKMGIDSLMNTEMEFDRNRVRKLLSDLNGGILDYKSNNNNLHLAGLHSVLNTNTVNGHEFVDLGLPSGLLWATCNVGATSPEQAGLYFAWGETEGITAEQVTGGERAFNLNTYNSGSAASISADLTLEQDAAHANMGGKWRVPTKAEYKELIDNCNSTWTTNYNGTCSSGWLFTSKTNGNSVFFPTSGYCSDSTVFNVGSNGYYWSASWGDSYFAWYLSFGSGVVCVDFDGRYFGQSVRGVCEC